MTNIVPLDYFDTNRLNQLKQRWIESPECCVQVTWGNESYLMDGHSTDYSWDAKTDELITTTFEAKLEKMDGVSIFHFLNSTMIGVHEVKSPFS